MKPRLLIVTGYLGAGKTTFLRRVIDLAAYRTAPVIVNDIGLLDFDAGQFSEHDGPVIALNNGCACCTLAAPMHETLAAAARQACENGMVFFEASGISLPEPIALTAISLGMFSSVHLVAIIDPHQFENQCQDRFIGAVVKRQVDAASVTVLNPKLDGSMQNLLSATNSSMSIDDCLSRISRGDFGPAYFSNTKSHLVTNHKVATGILSVPSVGGFNGTTLRELEQSLRCSRRAKGHLRPSGSPEHVLTVEWDGLRLHKTLETLRPGWVVGVMQIIHDHNVSTA